MKKIIFISLTAFVFLNSAFGFQFEEMTDKANNAYSNSEFDEAIQIYNQILDQGVESPEIYYNMGNSYFRLGRMGYAILYYEKTLKLNPDDEDALYNLKLAKARTVDRINDLPEVWIVNLWNSIISSLSILSWSFLVIIFYIALLSLIGLYLLTRNFKVRKLSFIVGIVLIPVLIMASVFMISKINRETSTEYGVLTENNYAVKLSPDEKSEDAFLIHEGLKFSIEDSLGDWVKIKLADGHLGWVPTSVFERI